MAEQNDLDKRVGGGVRGRRGPNFPYIDLPTAIQRVQQVYDKEDRNEAPVNSVASHWGYKVTSSSTDKVIGALKSYGLIETTGSGDDRMIKLSEQALDILEDERPDSKERAQALKSAALGPAIHQDIRVKYGKKLASDETLRTFLIREKGYNRKKVDGIISNYRASIEHAGLDSAENESDNLDDETQDLSPISVGTMVQWVSQGSTQFDSPRQVIRVDDFDGEQFVVVMQPNGVEGAFPMSQAEVAEVTPPKADPVAPLPLLKPGGAAQEPPATQNTGDFKTETIAIGDSQATVTWPKRISKDEFEDLDYWLKGVLRKAMRDASQAGEDPDS
ncbi:hypothetical protein [Mucisphaera calidilacus]|uniref:Uncharacterized protein n=1 Tax=Mucisphaera calidilacus TaxID=2527982 RepID=A0A518BZL1_9BACT|nr:hypothetical protein [Mucisphaera calidilacus]QDU72408.1 hypothetical protein Pan265_22730 [Mucisphaera calidilacus]